MNASKDSLSRRLGPVFAEVAAKPTEEQLQAEPWRAGTAADMLQPWLKQVQANALSKAYKPAHGGYPG